MSMGFAADVWRFYIMANRPEKRDTDFDFKSLQSCVGSELVDNLGNLVNRVLSFIAKRFGAIPPLGEPDADARRVLEIIDEKAADIERAYATIELRQAVTQLLALGTEGNRYVNLAEPWRLYKTDEAACGTALHVTARLIHRLAHLLWPVIPQAAEAILGAMGCELHDPFREGLPVSRPELLFTKIEDDAVEALTAAARGEAVDDDAAPLEFVKEAGVTWPCVILELTDLTVKRKVKAVRRWKQSVVNGVDALALVEAPHVRAYEALLTDGLDCGGRVSVINLLEIAQREGKLPDINSLVDIYNTWSIREGLVMGAYERKTIEGRLIYAVADGSERFIPVKGRDPEPIVPGEWVLKDDSNMVVTRVASKQSEAVAVTPSTTACAMCIQGNPLTQVAHLEAVAREMAAEIVARCGGSFRVVHVG